jgi:hypothetical protein
LVSPSRTRQGCTDKPIKTGTTWTHLSGSSPGWDKDKKREEIREKSKYVIPSLEHRSRHVDFWKNTLGYNVQLEKELGERGERNFSPPTPEPEKTPEGPVSKRTRPLKHKPVETTEEPPGKDEKPPKTLGEAKKGKFWPGFEKAITEEITNLENNNTWTYVDRNELQRGSNILRAKFVFDIKRGPTEIF